MKNSVLTVVFALLLWSCKNDQSTHEVVNESSGIINNVSIIIDNDLWNSEVGDSLRYKLASEVEGLPQSEPIFNLNQYPTNIFKGLMKNSRNIVIVTLGERDAFSLEQNRFAKPQNVAFITAKTRLGLIQLVSKYGDSIINSIKATEIVEKQKRIKKSLLNIKQITKDLQVTFEIPSAYQYATTKGDKFYWLKKEIPTGNSSLLIYQVPFNRIENDSNLVRNIIKIRDSIGKQFIHGTLDNTYMVTEAAYSPYFYETTVNQQKTYLTKGTWELKNDFMAGPFINYAIKDEKNQRFLIIEGFVYAPSKAKRDLTQELEAIIVSAKLQ